MPDQLRVFVNDRGWSLPPGARVREAVIAAAPDLLPACETGQAVLTDARGIAVPLDLVLESGAILRVARASRRPPAPGADVGA
jgi:hypothetical protein